MKIFGGSELVNEQNQRIRQLLGEGTGGMRSASTQPVNVNWRDLARQNIQEIASSSKQNSGNFAYLERFKESLDSRQVRSRPKESSPLDRISGSRSEKRGSSANKRSAISKPKVDINAEQLMSAQRRFSETRVGSRPKSAQPATKLLKTLASGDNNQKSSNVYSIIDSLQKLRTTNFAPTTSILDGLRQRQKSDRLIESASKNRAASKDRNDRLKTTPAPWPKEPLGRSNMNSTLKSFAGELDTKFGDKSVNNFLTPKARLVFGKRHEGNSDFKGSFF